MLMLETARGIATAVFGFLFLAVISALISANIRIFAAKRGLDTYLDEFVEHPRVAAFLRVLIGWCHRMIAGWQPLQRRWWLWLALGLSGGVAVTLWVEPSSEGRPPSLEQMPGSHSNPLDSPRSATAPSGLATKLQSQVDATTMELEATKRQLSDAQRLAVPSLFGPTPTEKGAINWNPDFQLIITGGGPTAQVNSVLFQGTSTALVEMKEAYAVSGMTGHKQELMENIQYKGYYHVDKVDIPAQAPVWLELIFNPAISPREFLDQWGKFRIVVTYNGTTFDNSYDEEYVSRVLRATNPGYFGPKPTPKDDK